jgi:all-trans-retinol dehydrogenase (NAD+)
LTGLDESVKIIESLGGWCRGQIVDISRREEVYKAADEIKSKYGNVSAINQCHSMA